jgi:hypothetical protein
VNDTTVVRTKDKTIRASLRTESMIRMDSEDAEDNVLLDPPNELLDSPYGLVRYINACSQFQMELLNGQLIAFAEIEPKICQKLNSLSENVLKLWTASSECDII